MLHMKEVMKILIVDDQPLNRLVMKKLLKTMKFTEVHEAKSGLAALEMVQRIDFDLIFMGLRMPGMDGLETIQHLRTTGVFSYICVLTAEPQEIKKPCMNHGSNAFLRKPIVLKEIQNVLESD